MTDADWLLLYAFSRIEDAELRNVLYRNRLDEALNIHLVEQSKRNIHFKNLVLGYGVRPDHIFEQTLSHIVEHIYKFTPFGRKSRPQESIKSYVGSVIRGYWCDMHGKKRSIYRNSLSL